jgi:hypothetical protein
VAEALKAAAESAGEHALVDDALANVDVPGVVGTTDADDPNQMLWENTWFEADLPFELLCDS